uniref:Chlorophyll a-b binding protein, chloroplastic n=1 Tax=Mesostigma viride TaxID=41882 RepID=A2SY18_MESVI|nr:light-harvesting chlorophyll-a/b binding protein Lhca5.2 [Mesostigma viride]DAA05927.1 TPA_inf: chloroplast light-harvesting complex I protein precursor Lhca9 [Mesostigma viride]|eukprot:jgi/Mesvir1/747/Mv17348-RA.1
MAAATVAMAGVSAAPLLKASFGVKKATAARDVTVRAADRTLWLPNTVPPAHLNGTLPGDYGYDPIGLATDPDRLAWFVEAERTNGRWAMAGVAGILFTDALHIGSAPWFSIGAELESPIPLWGLATIEFVIFGFLEMKRLEGWKKTGQNGLLNWFPFDPLGMNSKEMMVKEVKNGRLAMFAWCGFMVQALVTREGPVTNLEKHIADPFNNNFITSIANLPNVVGK